MDPRLHLFSDFHLHGANAPEWNQRYLQLSPGVMHSTLAEWTRPGVHVFRKWMSERVVQQGSLPPDRLCFALLATAPAGDPRVQGRPFGTDDLFVLRGAEAFEIQRPREMALLSVTFEREAFEAALDARPGAGALQRLLAHGVLRVPAPALSQLRGLLQARLASRAAGDTDAPTPLGAADDAPALPLMLAVLDLLAAADAPTERVAARTAARLVRDCQRLVEADGGVPPRIDDLCRRLGTSRRTLQSSFHQMAGSTPVHYLRSLRLNAVRSRLLVTPPELLSVSQAATDQGFDHLGHFATAYRTLFGELPSRTARGKA